jgi:hypothetical protein
LIGIVVAVAVSVLTGAAHQTRPPVFTARRDLVRLDVSVTDRGKPITGLQAGDFHGHRRRRAAEGRVLEL